MVDAADFTYWKGYLGLLSTLGASLGIIFCSAQFYVSLYHRLREIYLRHTSRLAQIDEESAATDLETPNIVSHPMIDVRATQNHDGNARWSMDNIVDGTEPPPYGRLKRHCTF